MFCDFLNSTFIIAYRKKTIGHFVLNFGFRENFDSICVYWMDSRNEIEICVILWYGSWNVFFWSQLGPSTIVPEIPIITEKLFSVNWNIFFQDLKMTLELKRRAKFDITKFCFSDSTVSCYWYHHGLWRFRFRFIWNVILIQAYREKVLQWCTYWKFHKREVSVQLSN